MHCALQWIFFSLVIMKLHVATTMTVDNMVGSIMTFLHESIVQADQEPDDIYPEFMKEYDFIIVGAGTAGSVLANRLTQVPDWKVLLIEAGGSENYIMDVPVLATRLQFTSANWNYKTQPQPDSCLGHKKQRCNWPRGRVMGGSSVLHSMIHTRGHREDYDRLERLGNNGWNYATALYYFKKMEKMEIDPLMHDSKFHSTDGEMHINYPRYTTPLANAFLKAGEEVGGWVTDYNGENMIGYSKIQFTLANGTRMSASKAYLHPIKYRNNLHVLKKTQVSKILIDPEMKLAYGVEFYKGTRKYRITTRKEVIISAGTINSPQLLMLSGIGPKHHLNDVGINTIQDLKVGYNLQDHIAAGGLIFLINDTVSIRFERIMKMDSIMQFMSLHSGPLAAPTGTEAIAFLNTVNASKECYPNLELLFVAGSLVSDLAYKDAFGIDDDLYKHVYGPIMHRDTWMVFPMLLLPKSKGRILLKDTNWKSKPLIYANYFQHPDDQEVILKGIRKVQELSRTKAFQKYGSTLHSIPFPNCAKHVFDSDAYWYCAMRTITHTIYHHTGTCSMGPPTDPDAVVNERLQVYGIRNLRVIDASVLPFVPAAHTNAPTLMIAERGADLIKEDHQMAGGRNPMGL